MFWETFVSLCQEHGEKPTPVIKKLGVAVGLVTKWKNGTMPNSVTLNKIANYFGVSVDYLLGKTDKKEKGLTKIGEAEEGYYLIANRSKDGKQGTERLTKSEYEALMAVIKTLRHNTDEDL